MKTEKICTFTRDELVHIRQMAKMGMEEEFWNLDAIAPGKKRKGRHGVEFLQHCSVQLFERMRDLDLPT